MRVNPRSDPAGPAVDCPTCGSRTRFAPSNPWRPFCSEKCRTIDLGAWASESYRVEAKPETGDENDTQGAP